MNTVHPLVPAKAEAGLALIVKGAPIKAVSGMAGPTLLLAIVVRPYDDRFRPLSLDIPESQALSMRPACFPL